MKGLSIHVGALALALAVAATPGMAQKDKDKNHADRSANPGSNAAMSRLQKEVRHELVMLPYYGVFDNLLYRVDGSTVTLMGSVTRPTLKSDAGNVVKGIEGVEKVDNQIQVLPLSSMDDGLRVAE